MNSMNLSSFVLAANCQPSRCSSKIRAISWALKTRLPIWSKCRRMAGDAVWSWSYIIPV